MLRRLLLGSGSLAAFVSAAVIALSSRGPRSQELFVIERSKNANVVRYDVRLDKSGAYYVRQPLDAYWLLRAEDGRREELTDLERRAAYGFEILPNAKASEFGVRLVAAKERPLAVRRRGGSYRAEIVIDGGTAVLESVFVATQESGIVPKVLYVELRGSSVAGGRPVRERIREK